MHYYDIYTTVDEAEASKYEKLAENKFDIEETNL